MSPSPKQRDFLESLLFGRMYPEGFEVPEDLDALTPSEASKIITLLVAQPYKPIDLGIPDGRYAVPAGKVDGRIAFRFYYVKTSEKGTQFMLRLFGAPGDFRRERMDKPLQVAIAQKIATDPALFSQMFGKELGSCGVCGSPLTDPESIERGIGPICLRKSGW